MFERILNDQIAIKGQSTLASELGISDTQLSQFKIGERGLHLATINRLLDLAGVQIVPKDKIQKYEDAVITVVEMLRDRRAV